jgi:hypothetical protein
VPHHHHRHSLADAGPPPAPRASAKGAAILHPPPVYPPDVQAWRQWSSSNAGVSSQSHMKGMSSGRSSGSSMSIHTEDAVLATQMENLPNFFGYLTAPSVAGWARVRFGFDGLQPQSAAFTPYRGRR